MNKASTNVELEDINVVGGSFVSDPERGKTDIPPKGEFKKESTQNEPGMIEITLIGKDFIDEIRKIQGARSKEEKLATKVAKAKTDDGR